MIVAGIGMKSGATPRDILEAIDAALHQSRSTRTDLDALATLEKKATEPGLRAVARELCLPVISLRHERLAALGQRTLTKSRLAIEKIGLPSLAETAALAALASGAELLGPRSASKTATCALATGNPAEIPTTKTREPRP